MTDIAVVSPPSRSGFPKTYPQNVWMVAYRVATGGLLGWAMQCVEQYVLVSRLSFMKKPRYV